MHDVFINTSVDKTMWGLPLYSVRSESGGSSTQSHDAVSTMLDGLRTLKTFDASLSAETPGNGTPTSAIKRGTALW